MNAAKGGRAGSPRPWTSKDPFGLGPSPALLKADQVAELLNASPRQVRRWMYEGQLETIRLSPRVVRVPRAAVERFVAERADQA